MTYIISTAFLCTLILLAECEMVYRKYQKENIKKKYIQIVEIFSTHSHPPAYIEDEKSLNDYIGRDAFKTDMNCSKIDTSTTEKPKTTTKANPTTAFPSTTQSTTIFTIPTTAYRYSLTTSPSLTITRAPNLDNLFTIRNTKPTIRPNPKENQNPDYTELHGLPHPNVQVTKHLPTTKSPLILIKETDVQATKNKTPKAPLVEEDIQTTTSSISDGDDYNDEGIDNEEDNENESEGDGDIDNYDENNYDSDNLDNNNLDDFENDENNKKRRKRQKTQHRMSNKKLIIN